MIQNILEYFLPERQKIISNAISYVLLYNGTGMMKYVKDYEYLVYQQYFLFDIMIRKNDCLKSIVKIMYEYMDDKNFVLNEYD